MKTPNILYSEQKLIVEDALQISIFNWQDIISIIYSVPYVEVLSLTKKILLYTSLINIHSNLPKHFIQCNRSTIIN